MGKEPSPARSASATTNPFTPTLGRRTARRAAGGEAAASTARARELPAAWWLGALVVVSAAVRFAIAAAAPAPAIFPDELIYSELGRSLGVSGHFLVRDAPFSAWTYGPLYPVLIAPAFRLSPVTAYTVVKAINCLALSLAAVPVYLLARRIVDRRQALLAAFVALALPSAAYSARVMTESVSYPLFLTAVLAFVTCLESPSARRQLGLLFIVGLSFLARAQGIVLVPAFVAAAVLLSVLDLRAQYVPVTVRTLGRRLDAFRIVWSVLLGSLLAALIAAVVRGRAPTSLVLGPHEVLLGRFRLLEAPRWIVLHVAELDLALGVIPFAAFLVLAATAFDRRRPRIVRVFIVTTVAVVACLVLLVGFYATQVAVRRVQERYLFYVEPLFVISLLAWIGSGRPRHGRLVVGAAITAALLPMALPYGRLLDYHVVASAPGLVPWRFLHVVGGTAPTVAVMAVLSVGAAVGFVRSRRAQALTAFVITYFAVGALLVSSVFVLASHRSLEAGVGSGERAWIDRAVGSGASVVAVSSTYKGDWERHRRIWESEFFNRSVGPVFYLRRSLGYNLPGIRVWLQGKTLVRSDRRPLRAEYVLSDGARIDGKRIAARPELDLTLYQVDGVVRVAG